ncbi:MAG: hypothetical protein NC084_04605 [Bacteroides sp.]|nr:hypothetical protein [Eubacterium sp.]MCM1418674.1 hypothetical protein [Roseburia sp.]MCM1461978.1 hypothetical protein [Bacteroides sp.]
MKHYFKSFFAVFCLLIGFTANGTTAAAVREAEIDDGDREHYNALLHAVDRAEVSFDEYQWLCGDGDKLTGVPSRAETELFNEGSAVFSFTCDLSRIAEEHRTSPEFDLYAVFVLHEDVGKYYTCEFSVLKNSIITSEEIKKAARLGQAGIASEVERLINAGWIEPGQEDEEVELPSITGIEIYERMDFNRAEWFKGQPADYPATINEEHFIQRFSVIDPSKRGWTETTHDRWNADYTARGTTDRFYVKKDGSLATGSTTIDGVRYKFDKSGVCQGEYTGFTSSDKGRRYWKNGTLVKNKWIRVKGARKYYAGADGYFVTGTATIDGAEYTFAENGAVVN